MSEQKLRRAAATAIGEILEIEVAAGRDARWAFRDYLVVAGAAVVVTGITVTGIVVGTNPGSAPQAAPSDHSTSPADTDGTGMVFVDGPTFGSIAELAETAEVIVEGKFGAAVGSESEGSLNVGGDDGLEFELWTFLPDQVVRGSLDRTSINVSQVATTVEGAVRPADEGRRAILFLKRYPNGDFAIVGLGMGALIVAPDGSVSIAPQATQKLKAKVRNLTDDQVIAKIRSQAG
jgi:hypothetical protein